jgi:hypothetical protein
MHPRVCIACGGPIAEEGKARFGNPNLCVSCSGLTDDMEVSDAPELTFLEESQPAFDDRPVEIRKAA